MAGGGNKFDDRKPFLNAEEFLIVSKTTSSLQQLPADLSHCHFLFITVPGGSQKLLLYLVDLSKLKPNSTVSPNMKGERKRKLTYFQQGHKFNTHLNKPVTNPGDNAAVDTTDSLSPKPEVVGPKTRAKSVIEEKLGKSNDQEYLILSKTKIEQLANNSFRTHSSQYPTCQGFLHLKKHDQLVISSQLRFVCDTCSYVGKTHKMYTEIEGRARGRKASSLNRALGVALTKSPIGVAVCTEIFLTLGIDPGSKRGMQDNLNKTSDLIQGLALENMRDERLKLARYPEVAVEVDTRYNNPLRSPNTPFQGGTQAVFTVAENMTPSKKIISATFANKICTAGSRQIAYGLEVSCPNHEGCTATMAPQDAIGMEERYAEESALILKNDKINLATVTHDQDSGQLKGFLKHFPNLTSLKDSRHYSQSQRKAIV